MEQVEIQGDIDTSNKASGLGSGKSSPQISEKQDPTSQTLG